MESAESSSTSSYNGVYYNDGECRQAQQTPSNRQQLQHTEACSASQKAEFQLLVQDRDQQLHHPSPGAQQATVAPVLPACIYLQAIYMQDNLMQAIVRHYAECEGWAALHYRWQSHTRW